MTPSPDSSARLVCLAGRGRQAQSRAREMERVVEREWERHLGRPTHRALREALTELRAITDPYH